MIRKQNAKNYHVLFEWPHILILRTQVGAKPPPTPEPILPTFY